MILSIIFTKQELLESMVQDTLSTFPLMILYILLTNQKHKHKVIDWFRYFLIVCTVMFIFLILLKTIKYNTL